jgi:uncharacterized protein (DUF1499 family)
MVGSRQPGVPRATRRRWRSLCTGLCSALAALALLLIPVAAPAAASLLPFHGTPPQTLGPTAAGRLRPCPGPDHCAERLWSVPDPDDRLRQLAAAAAALPGTTVLTEENGYVHATSESRLFGFVDDLELLALPEQGLIQARSESRLGESDLGVNARRLDRLAAYLGDPDRPAPSSTGGG